MWKPHQPPSDEGGRFCEAKDGGRGMGDTPCKSSILRKISLSLRVYDPAPSSEGAQAIDFCYIP